MPVRRKVFRIEELLHGDTPGFMPVANAELAMCQHETLRELKALRAMVERRPAVASDPDSTEIDRLRSELHGLYETIKNTKQEIASLHVAGFHDGQMVQVSNELGAVVGSAENATQRILAAAEIIDAHADTLAKDLWGDHQIALTQDIQNGVIRIFEACVFQDLTGQRIAKVTAALKTIEDHVTRMIDIWGGLEAFEELISSTAERHAATPKLINGPQLDEESEHVAQNEVDAIFASFRPD